MDFFVPVSRLFALTTSATVSTSQSRLVLSTDLYGNKGTTLQVEPVMALWGAGGTTPALVFVGFTPTSGQSVVVPTPGTTTVGVPQPALVFDASSTRMVFFKAPTLQGDPAGTGIPGIFMQDLSATASVNYFMQWGYRGIG